MPQQNMQGIVQRLIAKEKQVLQLQKELDQFKAQSSADDQEAVSYHRIYKVLFLN